TIRIRSSDIGSSSHESLPKSLATASLPRLLFFPAASPIPYGGSVITASTLGSVGRMSRQSPRYKVALPITSTFIQPPSCTSPPAPPASPSSQPTGRALLPAAPRSGHGASPWRRPASPSASPCSRGQSP